MHWLVPPPAPPTSWPREGGGSLIHGDPRSADLEVLRSNELAQNQMAMVFTNCLFVVGECSSVRRATKATSSACLKSVSPLLLQVISLDGKDNGWQNTALWDLSIQTMLLDLKPLSMTCWGLFVEKSLIHKTEHVFTSSTLQQWRLFIVTALKVDEKSINKILKWVAGVQVLCHCTQEG